MQTVRPWAQVSTLSSVSVVRALNTQNSCGVRGCCWLVGIVLVGRWYEHPWARFCVSCRPCTRVAGAKTSRHPEEWRDATQHHQRWWQNRGNCSGTFRNGLMWYRWGKICFIQTSFYHSWVWIIFKSLYWMNSHDFRSHWSKSVGLDHKWLSK